MTTRLFIVQVQCDQDTCFLGDDRDFLLALRYANNNVAESWSKGPRPKVEIVPVNEDPEQQPLSPGQLVVLIVKK